MNEFGSWIVFFVGVDVRSVNGILVKLAVFVAFSGAALLSPVGGANAATPDQINVGGANQSTQDTRAFPNQLTATVYAKDSHGNEQPQSGIRVQFTAPDFPNPSDGSLPSQPSGYFGSGATLCTTPADGTCVILTTDSNGNVTAPTFYANKLQSSQTYAVQVTLPDYPGGVTNSIGGLQNTLGPVSSIQVVSPMTTTTFPPSKTENLTLTTKTVNSGGNAVGNVPVTFAVVTGSSGASGTLSGSTNIKSDPTTGIATYNGSITTSSTQGLYTITASISTGAVTAFAMNNGAGRRIPCSSMSAPRRRARFARRRQARPRLHACRKALTSNMASSQSTSRIPTTSPFKTKA